MTTEEYAPGRHADLYGDPADPVALVWHGLQADSRAAVRPLAERIAGHGVHVVAADWNARAADRGRGDLLGSAEFARQRGGGALVVVGWSMGGAAAAALTFRASELGVPVRHTVCLAGAFTAPDPFTGAGLDVPDGPATPFLLLHGTADDVVPPSVSTDFAASLRAAGWDVTVGLLDTDHGAIAGAVYDAAADRYDPAEDAASLATAATVAERIAQAVLGA
ncbi:esterase [Mycobacterium sp. MYCO198283]|uniref:alpha/beta hydrolase n=1 Tax=Mycobacterium sp. MYCO198283 TaxID=2883505 RepID=UPI001E313B0A|nr:esterase [Mycobacterium sp. MYCO198283]MCG5433278.1 esterase [Mycobacterium sp. MYCO198283]